MKTIHNITSLAFAVIISITEAVGQPKITYPDGGETLTVGSTVNITWSGTALNTEVGIDYTIDNWANTIWLNTAYKNPLANSYKWVIPNTPGSKCKVGIFNTSFEGDISDNFFVIQPSTSSISEPVTPFNSITIFPNPSNSVFSIHNPLNAPLAFTLYDLTGRILPATFTDDGEGTTTLENRGLSIGIYLLEIKDKRDGKNSLKKIVVSN
jgi:hypothetical protein